MIRILLFVMVLGGLAGTNLYLYQTEIETAPIMPTNRDFLASIDAGDNPSENNDFSSIAIVETYARPLFSPTRRPFVPAQEGVLEAPVVEEPEEIIDIEPPQIAILALQAGPNGTKALVQENEGASTWVSQGAQLSGWNVISIDAETITLQHQNETLAFSLYPSTDYVEQNN